MSAYHDPLIRLRQLRGVLAGLLNEWEDRSHAGATAAQVSAGGAAVDTLDSMLALIYEVRTQLVLERRTDQDARARRADQPIARREADEPRRILCAHAYDNGRGMHWLRPGEVCPVAERPGGEQR